MDVSSGDGVEAAARQQDHVGLVLRHGGRSVPVLVVVPGPGGGSWLLQRKVEASLPAEVRHSQIQTADRDQTPFPVCR